MQKIPLLLGTLFTLSSLSALSLYQANSNSQEQLSDYDAHVNQLLSQVEENSLRRLEDQKQISQLQSELTMVNSQLTALNNQLNIAAEKANPEYERIENDIRQQLLREQQASQAQSDSKLDLIRKITALDPAELGEIMMLQGRYGGFLQSLNVGDERMEVIVGALSNMIAEDSQARMDIMLTAQQNPDGAFSPRDMRRQMQELNNPERQLEALSYALTEDELAAFSEFQSSQRLRTNSTAAFVGGPGPGGRSALRLLSTDGGDTINFVEAIDGAGFGVQQIIELAPDSPVRHN